MSKKKETEEYSDQSIIMLKDEERVRLRPAVIFGSDGLEGCEHSFFEILSNSVDEAREGFGSEITIRVFRDDSVEVEDNGRGVPLGFNEKEQQYNWKLIYCELYAGGKYNNNSSDSPYEYSLGLNGLGACATQYASEYFRVDSFDGKNESSIYFEKGKPASELSVKPVKGKKKTGTIQRWKPDLDVFTSISVPKEYYFETLKKQAVVNSGIHFILEYEEEDGKVEKNDFYYENGIQDYVLDLAGDDPLTRPVLWRMEKKGKDREDKEEYKLKAEISFCVSLNTQALEYYHNSSFLEYGGSPDKAVKLAFTYALDRRIKELGKYTKSESKISFQDIQDCLVLVSNSFSTMTSYENQTKKAINNSFIMSAMYEFIKEQLEIYFKENPLDGDRFVSQVLINKRSREQAEATRLNLKSKLSSQSGLTKRVEKFVPCRSKDADIRELYIVEGDSALTSCKLGRNAEYQAIIPVRGKTLNCLKASYQKIFTSDIICDLIRVVGCGVELPPKIKSDLPPFDAKALRWSKIILCTDADEDGYQIRTLLLTMFYRLLPTLIYDKKVYIAESPLYEITLEGKSYFAYNEPEKTEILRKFGDKQKKAKIQRSKGLGENEPDMMWQTTMNPETRRLIRVVPCGDKYATRRVFDALLGDNIIARKEFISQFGNSFVTQADV